MTEEDEIDLLEENEVIEKPKKKVVKKAFENPAPKTVIKKKIVVKIPTPPITEKSESESEEEEEEEPKPVKPKRERTQKQIDAFNKCIQMKKEKAQKRADEAKRLAEYDRKALEEKVVKKAISIKKKQIKKQSALDEISDDDTPIEKIKEVAKTIKPIAPAKPVIAFKFI